MRWGRSRAPNSPLLTKRIIQIYYEVVSAATIAKNDLWKSLYVQATSLLNTVSDRQFLLLYFIYLVSHSTQPPVIPDKPTPGQLEALLIWYRDNKMFQHDYGFPFKGTPDGLIKDLGRPTHLFIVQDDDYSKLSQEIQQSVLRSVLTPSLTTSRTQFNHPAKSICPLGLVRSFVLSFLNFISSFL